MKHYIMAVHDRQLDAFMRPFVALTVGQAMRSFKDEANRKESEINAHPEDYALYELGLFDDKDGKLDSHNKPIQVALATNLIGA